jgi:hypothetical protein
MANYDFPPTSRYYGIEVATFTAEDSGGASAPIPVPFLRRRFLPQTDGFVLLHEYRVAAGDRPDLVAARELGDPEAYWRLCDANGAMHPDDLLGTVWRALDATVPAVPAESDVDVGRTVRITLPAGVPPPARE